MNRTPDDILDRLERRAARRGPWWIPNYVWRLIDITDDDNVSIGANLAAMFAVVIHVLAILAASIATAIVAGVNLGWPIGAGIAVWLFALFTRAVLRAGERNA